MHPSPSKVVEPTHRLTTPPRPTQHSTHPNPHQIPPQRHHPFTCWARWRSIGLEEFQTRTTEGLGEYILEDALMKVYRGSVFFMWPFMLANNLTGPATPSPCQLTPPIPTLDIMGYPACKWTGNHSANCA